MTHKLRLHYKLAGKLIKTVMAMEEEGNDNDEVEESSALKLNYNSREVVEERIKQMLQRVEDKTKSKHMNKDEILVACHVMIYGITSRPRFQHLKLLNCERLVFEPEAGKEGIQRPKASQLSNLMSPWLELSDIAYETTLKKKNETLESVLENILGSDYSLVKHSTDAQETEVAYYVVSNQEKKHIIIGIRGTSTTTVSTFTYTD